MSAKVFVAGGSPSWPGELDFCPDVILRGGMEGRVPRFAFVGPGFLISPATVATAYHEAGHAVVGFKLSSNVPRKISVIPVGGSMDGSQLPLAEVVPAREGYDRAYQG